jgi:hypothetical protein
MELELSMTIEVTRQSLASGKRKQKGVITRS